MPKGKNLKYCRTKAGFSQQAFADEIGVSKVSVSAWENLKTSIPPDMTERIARFFGYTYVDFCNENIEALDAEYGDVRLTPIEAENIKVFRTLPDEVKDNIRKEIKLWQKLIQAGQ